jgi:hypothetical protein
MSFLRSIARGLLAAAIGTLAMDTLWYLRYRRGGGSGQFLAWEFASVVKSWADAPAPARLAKVEYEAVTKRPLPLTRETVADDLSHWAYALMWGCVFGAAIGSPRRMRPWHGPMLGVLTFLTGYVVLPIAGVYKPIWTYDANTLWQDLSAHLVYGTTVGAAFRWLGVREA